MKMKVRATSGDGALPSRGPRVIELEVYADYYQFYVADQHTPCDTSVIWDDPTTTDHRLAVGDQLVAVGTKRYGTVPVRIEIRRRAPKVMVGGVDRINECGLTITTALVVAMFISEPTPTPIEIEPGHYRVRVLYFGQDSVESDWVGADRYVVQLWPTKTLLSARYIAR
jgi:hypothetical protein